MFHLPACLDEALLQGILSIGIVAGNLQCEPVKARHEALEQAGAGEAVAFAQSLQNSDSSSYTLRSISKGLSSCLFLPTYQYASTSTLPTK